jgi:pyridoxamine 5'-phosphate oxidase
MGGVFMTKSDILEFIRNNPVFCLATVDDGVPRVRGMMIHKADEDGIILVTFKSKDLHVQIMKDPRVELCFFHDLNQVRVTGKLEELEDNAIKDEVLAQRSFIQPFVDSVGLTEYYKATSVYELKNGTAIEWTLERNFEPKIPIQL